MDNAIAAAAALRDISGTTDLLEKSLKLAGLVTRVFRDAGLLLAYTPEPNAEGRAVAAKMLAACLSGATPIDWNEVERLAALPTFKIGRELAVFKQEVSRELGR